MDESTKQAIKTARLYLSTLLACTGWKAFSTSKGVEITTLDVEGESMPAIKGQAVVDIGVEELIATLRGDGTRKICELLFVFIGLMGRLAWTRRR